MAKEEDEATKAEEARLAREALINEIVAELKKDSIKQDAQSLLSKRGLREAIPKFLAHPAFLLVIGFVITGLIGGWLANRWQRQEWTRQQPIQSREWDRQQLRLVDIHGINQRYTIIDEITKAIGERNAAAKGILSPLTQQLNDQQLIQEEKEWVKSWERVNNDWRVNSQILKLKIATYIVNPEAARIFGEISENEKNIAVGIVIVKRDLRKYNRAATDADARKHLDGILNDINKTEQGLKLLASVIATEARSEIQKQP